MKTVITVTLLAFVAVLCGFSQEPDPAWGIKFTGFVKTDILYDTRQPTTTAGLREGHFYLFPDNALFDADGNDINDNPSFHILNIQTRLKGDISGPDAFGARTSGLIEAEFFGTGESDINGFRLRHAYVKLDWPSTSLLTGQYWHPMFPVESYPGTLSFNTGAPFTPFSRNPQVRLTQQVSIASVSLTAYAQRDFASAGPDGTSNKYLRNSGMPGFDLLFRIPAGDIFTGFFGADYKKLRPEIRTSANRETDATIGSFSFYANVKAKTSVLNASMMAVYGQNASDLMMIGGYAVSEIINPVSQFKKFTTINTGNIWIDVGTTGTRFTAGLFAGLSKNLGASKDIVGAIYGRGTNIDHIFRISPRVTMTEGKFSFAGEIESTTAAYGTIQTNGKVTNTDNISNLRILVSTIYKF
jgi:hypothetical protein